MQKRLYAIIITGLSFLADKNMLAQEAFIPNRGCASMEYKEMEEKADPSIKERRAKLEEEARNYMENQKINPIPHAVIIIPVVFHVVYNGAAENVSDACLAAQLKVINDDYRKLNSDWTKVTQTGWSSLVADCEIQFCMAVRDPTNAPTTGITRTSTTAASFGLDNKVKYTAQGGHDIWDRNKYFNIWVCDLDPGYLGVGSFPGSPAATDGLLIDYQYMIGAQGCGTAPYNKGRTATHEIGHCLNLKHIWGDDGAGQYGKCSGTALSQCNGTDNITDTPNQCGATYGTLTAGSVQTDICSATAPGIMWMNYMDYTDDASMYMFTADQKLRIAATMNGPRAALKTSNGCTPISGVETLLSSESISIFPNPSSGNFSLNIHIPGISSANIVIYNAIGEAVLEKRIVISSGNNVEVDMNKYPDGMYLVKLKTAEGTVTKKVAIHR